MRKIDGDHLKSRLNRPKNYVEETMVNAFIKFIDEEPELVELEHLPIDWIISTRDKSTRDVKSIRYGVECSTCKHFQDIPTRYCPDCGGKFDGELIKIGAKKFYRGKEFKK